MIGQGNDCVAPLYISIPGYSEKLRVKCGRCVACKMHRSFEWSVRLEMESLYWSNCSFLTLTYDNENLPYNMVDNELINKGEGYSYFPTLFPRDLQLFLKRLRKNGLGEEHQFIKFDYNKKDFVKFVRKGFKYFAVGEYGTNGTKRSHYHLILFGIGNSVENNLFISKCWNKGFILLKSFFPETCRYVAGYVQKKLYDDYLSSFVRFPEFMRCSQSLGVNWLYNNLFSFSDDKPFISYKGFNVGLPKLFRKFLVEKNILSESSLISFALQQNLDYLKLVNDCGAKGVTLSDFFRQRYKNLVFKARKKNIKRDITGDI